MSTKLIVTNYKNFKCGVKLNEGELVNIRFQPNEDVQIGDIYKVKIAEILPNDSGAFVTYGKGDQRGFFKRINLPNGDKVHEGQSLLLQVRSIGSKDKVHLFTNNIILTGKFINLLPYGDEIILSRRTRKNLDTNQQDKIMDALSESEVGLIARHNLVPENLDIAQAELKSLNQQWKDIELNAKVYIKEWDKDIRVMLEEAGYFGPNGFRYVNGRQTKFLLIGNKNKYLD